jgi:hypothetical protein
MDASFRQVVLLPSELVHCFSVGLHLLVVVVVRYAAALAADSRSLRAQSAVLGSPRGLPFSSLVEGLENLHGNVHRYAMAQLGGDWCMG